MHMCIYIYIYTQKIRGSLSDGYFVKEFHTSHQLNWERGFHALRVGPVFSQ